MVERPGFWRRQFQEQVTPRQRVFDVVFGIIAPIVCVACDPCVFRNNGPFPQAWISHGTAAYIFIALEIVTFSIWMAVPRKGPFLTLALAGPMIAGGLAAIGLGIRMLPLSMIGLFLVIGILGFTPFATGVVYLRNGVRAWRSLQEEHRTEFHRGVAVFFAFFTMGLAIAGQWASDRSMSELVANPDSVQARRVARWLGTGSRTDELLVAWEKETDPVRKDRLARTYRDMTGQDIETRQAILRD